MAESTIEKETGSAVKNTFYCYIEGAGLSFLSPNRLPKGGLRRSEQSDRLSDCSYGGDLRG